MKQPTSLIPVNLKLQDQLNGLIVIKPTSVKESTYNEIEQQIKDGFTFNHFDKVRQIACNYKIIGIEHQ